MKKLMVIVASITFAVPLFAQVGAPVEVPLFDTLGSLAVIAGFAFIGYKKLRG